MPFRCAMSRPGAPIAATSIAHCAISIPLGIRPQAVSGVQLFTLAAEFTLHPIFATPVPSPPQRAHQIHQTEQVLDPEVNSLSIPGAAHLDDLELLAMQPMKRMRDGETTQRFECARCSWSIVPTPFSEASTKTSSRDVDACVGTDQPRRHPPLSPNTSSTRLPSSSSMVTRQIGHARARAAGTGTGTTRTRITTARPQGSPSRVRLLGR